MFVADPFEKTSQRRGVRSVNAGVRTARSLALLGLVVFSGCAAITPPPKGESIRRDLVYAKRPTGDLHLDLYLPAGPGPHPVVMWIHGGGWKYGDKAWMLFMRKLTQQGFAIASVQYRLSGTAKYPAQIEDCEEAFRWLRIHAAGKGLDVRNIFVAGSSAGGHLAALVALEEGRDKVRAAAVMYPATDLTAFGDNNTRKGYLPPLLGGTVNEKYALAQEGSPVNHVHHDSPPFLIFHGAKDELVPVAQSYELQRRLRAAGVECRLIVLPEEVHNFQLNDAQLQAVGRFFFSHRRK
jgi:acetyl esterase/lipase